MIIHYLVNHRVVEVCVLLYSRAQGYDNNTCWFYRNIYRWDFRIVLVDNVQAFNGDSTLQPTVIRQMTMEMEVLGDYDLQVKALDTW